MRALVCKEYGPPESLVIEELPDPVAGKGEIVVDVEAAGINFPDVLMIAGKYQVKTPTPFVPGNEAAGVVSAVGDGVKRIKTGDRVIIMTRGSAFAEKVVAEELTTMPLPDGLDFEQGAGFAVTYGTSYHALKQSANLEPGETVLVLGAAGGVGITAVEIAKAMGARVIAAASSDEKLEFAKSAGADEVINYSNESLKERAKELTDGKGVDVVYDPVGGELADQSLRSLAWHGRYLVVGFASGDIPSLPLNLALLKEARIVGVWYGAWAERHSDELAANAAALGEMIAGGAIRPRCSETFALEDFVAAFRVLAERRVLGKVVFRIG